MARVMTQLLPQHDIQNSQNDNHAGSSIVESTVSLEYFKVDSYTFRILYFVKGIGTEIIRDILSNNDIVYLWVYKKNDKAISLYRKLGFNVIEETESRYYMKYNK